MAALENSVPFFFSPFDILPSQANMCQCQRLGARLAALKKPMVAVHRGKQTADHAVLSTIKDLVAESQHFMERYGTIFLHDLYDIVFLGLISSTSMRILHTS